MNKCQGKTKNALKCDYERNLIMGNKIEDINMLFVLFSVNFVKELKGSSVDKALEKQERNELLEIVAESIDQTIKDVFDECNEEKNEGDRKDA